MIIGIDSMVLIYAEAVPRKGKSHSVDFHDLRTRAKLLLLKASERKHTILLPTIAISELLVPVPTAQKGALIALLQRKFVCPPFDITAASIAADLISQHQKLPQEQKYDKRNVLRADAMIVASVRAAGATDFFSHDGNCRALASLVMKAHDLPTGKETLEDIFISGDIRRGEA
jgi:hypothetical protein